jgi:retron-type reverse transcriptase
MTSGKVRLEQIADPDNLREAFLRAAKGKSARAEVRAFRADLGGELADLRAAILAGEVRVGQFAAFTIFEPKERRIHAPCFRERVLHHALVAGCEADFERWAMPDSYACRRGKGREAALRRAEALAGRQAWFLKLDVEKYFDSIPHATLLAEIARRFRDRRVVALWARIVGSYEKSPGRGLPIGALTSQHLANLYLGAADRCAQETLRVPGYVRYMDDMALWGGREELKAARPAMERFLNERLGLKLKSNWHLQPTARGMDFLGYRVLPGTSRLARRSRRRFLRRWLALERARETGAVSDAAAQRRVLALAGFVRAARGETLLARLFGRLSGTGHRAPTASTAAAAGGMTPRIAAPRIATGIRRAIATTTSVSASPSAHATQPGGLPD